MLTRSRYEPEKLGDTVIDPHALTIGLRKKGKRIGKGCLHVWQSKMDAIAWLYVMAGIFDDVSYSIFEVAIQPGILLYGHTSLCMYECYGCRSYKLIKKLILKK